MYLHDETYDILKRVDEGVKVNYTSSQYLKTLDHFIWKALDLIIELSPELFLNYVTKIVGQQMVRTLKMTSSDKKDLPDKYVQLMIATDSKSRIECAKELYLNRGILMAFLTMFRHYASEYYVLASGPYNSSLDESSALSAKCRLMTSLSITSDHNLYQTLHSINYWTDEAYRFKNVIVEKYIRMTLNHARRTYIDCQGKVRLGDIIGSYMITLSKAIDRCDSRHGVLTTFIQNWFRGARSRVMDTVVEQHSEESLEAKVEELGDNAANVLGSTDADSSMEVMQTLSEIAKRYDPDGYVRTSLSIPEHVTAIEYSLLRLLEAPEDGY